MFKVIGDTPQNHPAETDQFSRVIEILRHQASKLGSWVVVLCNFNYAHYSGELIEGDKSWSGQIDLLVLAPNRIVIYELKGFATRIAYGRTDKRNWKIYRLNSDHPDQVRSFFDQVSKQRTFLLQEYFNSFRERVHPPDSNHYVVDARLVFKTGSDLSGFFYNIPMTENYEEFETDVISQVTSENDQKLLREAFSGRKQLTGKLQRVNLPSEKYNRLKQIYLEYNIKPRTQKWFRILTEDKIESDINYTGSDRFELRMSDAETMASDFGLI